jgi:tetratricopeptide (TPR) repeat protein
MLSAAKISRDVRSPTRDHGRTMDADGVIARATEAIRAGQPETARQLLSPLIISLREANARRELARALRALGEAERQLPDSDSGAAAYEEAVTLARSLGEPRFLAHTVRHLGDIHRHKGDFERAAACYGEALALYRADAGLPPLDAANAHRAMALLQEQHGMRGTADAHWREAKRFYDAAGVEAGSRECGERLARRG